MLRRFVVRAAIFVGTAAVAIPSFAQAPAQRPSPAAKANCSFSDGKSVNVDYSSPRAKGRKTVPAGTYTLFTVPNQDKWTLIINKTTKNAKGGPLWGVPYPGEEGDFARVDMRASKLGSPVENFTISFDKSASGCTMNLDWDTTRASIDISEKK